MQLASEKNMSKRREILEGLLAALEVHWTELLYLIAREEDQERVLQLVGEIKLISEERRALLNAADVSKSKRKRAAAS